MGIPWLLALKAIPWDTIVATTPALLRSAESLLSRTKTTSAGPATGNDLQALAERIAALERRDRETAELLASLSAQVASITAASEVLEARLRWLVAVTIASAVTAAVACAVAILMRSS